MEKEVDRGNSVLRHLTARDLTSVPLTMCFSQVPFKKGLVRKWMEE